MKTTKRSFLQTLMTASFAAVALLACPDMSRAGENALEAVPLGVEAYIYGYPLVTMEMTRRIMTNVEKVTATIRTAVDQADLPAIGTQVKALMAVAKRVVDNVDLAVVRGREGLTASLTYLQEGLENFSEFANSIRENPSLLFSAPKEQERETP